MGLRFHTEPPAVRSGVPWARDATLGSEIQRTVRLDNLEMTKLFHFARESYNLWQGVA